MSSDGCVRVALRIRPMLSHESSIGCQTCISEVPGVPQVTAGSKAFTYDYVYGSKCGQSPIFDNCVIPLLDKFFEGFNCTILAYGQTGAGKTHTMGTADLNPSNYEDSGIIPRLIHEVFSRIADSHTTTYGLKSTYLEIINEEVKDLLTGTICPNAIRENQEGGIVVVGLKEAPIIKSDDLYECLRLGAKSRAVASHALNSQSSRSHAVFTLILEQQQKDKTDSYLISKFNLVDLAGSERAKRTKAEGDRLKEGININKGLLALGNVISALGDPDNKSKFVPYRDSKITRLLQDSLGGNSLTLMVACCSPADSNLEETVNTLRYADRARKIKNKAVVNRDPKVAELLALRAQIAELQGKVVDGGGVDSATVEKMRSEIESLKEGKESLLLQLRGSERSMTEKITKLAELASITQMERDKLKDILQDLIDKGVLEEEALYNEDDKTLDLSEADISVEEAVTADTRRKELGEQLSSLSEMLASHETHASSLMKSDETLALLQEQYKSNLSSLNTELEERNGEKLALEVKIEELEKSGKQSDLLKQKNEALAALQQQIKELQNKCKENEKLLKINKGNNDQLNKLSKEILAMKKKRVDLLKDLRAETKKFQKFKQTKDKEMVQMKRFEEKKRAEVYKQAAAQQRQANVLKRKYEEAQSANKRLKDQIEKQQKAQSKRVGPGKSMDIKGLLKGHVELKLSVMIAKEAIVMYIEQRKQLHAALIALKKLPQTDKVRTETIETKHQLDYKSNQISGLQNAIMKLEQNETKNNILKQINSINDAKTGLKWFEGYTLELLMKDRSVHEQLELDSEERAKLREELAARELTLEERLKQEEEENMKLRKEFEESNKLWTLKFDRVKSLRSNLPATIKASEFARRRFGRSDSLGSTDNELEFKDVDEVWMEENKDLVRDMENVGLKTPKSIKKILKRRTTTRRKACTCKGNCKSKICGCRKLKQQCGDDCKCDKNNCMNKPFDDPEPSLNPTDVSRELLFSLENKENGRDSSGSDFTPLKRPPTSKTKRESKAPRIF